MNTFFNFQFNCCPVIWMFHSQALYKSINGLYERCMRRYTKKRRLLLMSF